MAVDIMFELLTVEFCIRDWRRVLSWDLTNPIQAPIGKDADGFAQYSIPLSYVRRIQIRDFRQGTIDSMGFRQFDAGTRRTVS